MKVIKIYEPAMCCSTGVCGPSVDTELLRITALMNQLNKEEKLMERFNLIDQPMAFVENQLVNQLLNDKGMEVLPITLLQGNLVKTGAYPSNDEIEKLLAVRLKDDESEKTERACCCNDGGC